MEGWLMEDEKYDRDAELALFKKVAAAYEEYKAELDLVAPYKKELEQARRDYISYMDEHDKRYNIEQFET